MLLGPDEEGMGLKARFSGLRTGLLTKRLSTNLSSASDRLRRRRISLSVGMGVVMMTEWAMSLSEYTDGSLPDLEKAERGKMCRFAYQTIL